MKNIPSSIKVGGGFEAEMVKSSLVTIWVFS